MMTLKMIEDAADRMTEKFAGDISDFNQSLKKRGYAETINTLGDEVVIAEQLLQEFRLLRAFFAKSKDDKEAVARAAVEEVADLTKELLTQEPWRHNCTNGYVNLQNLALCKAKQITLRFWQDVLDG